MKMNIDQTKLVGLTMELDLKAKEYKELCDQLEQLKSSNIDPNDEKLLDLAKKFLENQEEIKKIVLKLEKLKNKV